MFRPELPTFSCDANLALYENRTSSASMTFLKSLCACSWITEGLSNNKSFTQVRSMKTGIQNWCIQFLLGGIFPSFLFNTKALKKKSMPQLSSLALARTVHKLPFDISSARGPCPASEPAKPGAQTESSHRSLPQRPWILRLSPVL